MNKERTLQWTAIDTTSDDTGDEEFQLNLNKELEEATNNGKQQESQSPRRGILTVQTGKKKEAEEDDQDFSKGQENQDEGEDGQGSPRKLESSGEKKTRAHKRIQTLLAREREYQAALQQQAQEIQRLSGRTRAVEKTSAVQQRDQWEQAIKDKEAALEEAANKSDGASVAKLTRELADATMRFNAFKAVSEEYEQEPEQEQRPQQQQIAPNVPEAAKEWLGRNPWFQTDAKKHALARMISAELSQEGTLDPNEDEYWEELDSRIADFTGNKAKSQNKEPEQEVQQSTPARRRGSPVGSRSDEDGESPVRLDKQFSRTGNKVSATPTDRDYELAEQFGIKVSDLLKERYKYAQQGYSGYVPIDIPGQ